MVVGDNLLFVEKYRPQTVEDCILPVELKKVFQQYVKDESIPNMLLSGPPGVGKTTVAVAMCKEIGADYLIVNGSQETGIDLLRVKLDNYCSSVSLTGGRKVVIIDEADYLNPNSTQPAMRGFIERFANNCSFIFTCNYIHRIIEPIHSRCAVIEFKILPKHKPKIATQLLERISFILKDNNISYEESVLAQLIMKYFPDFRRTLNELQRYCTFGKIDSGILTQIGDLTFQSLMKALKEKRFYDVREWVTNNADQDPKTIYRKLYDNLSNYIEPTSIPQAILILADYQYKSAFAADQQLNLAACLVEFMVDIEIK